MRVRKSRYWQLIFYPENMVDNWQSILPTLVQVPFCYCVHDKDTLSGFFLGSGESDLRKTHVHIILIFDGPTTLSNCKSIIEKLALPGKICCPVGEPIVSVDACYHYLIHDTANARLAGKFEYPKEERIEGNNFDIDLYNSVTTAQKQSALKFLSSLILARGFINFADFYSWVLAHDTEEGIYFSCVSSYSGFLERLIKGNYLKSFGDVPEVK